MSRLSRVAVIAPKGDFNYNVLLGFAADLGSAIEARGLEVTVIDSSAPDFRRELLHCAADPATAVYAGHFFYDLGLVHATEMDVERVSLFEALDRPVFARIADHPFAKFMWRRIEDASPTTHFLMPSLEFKPEVQFLNPALVNFHKVTPTVTLPIPAESEVPSLAQRPIDIFMPCGFKPILPKVGELRQEYAKAGTPMVQVIDETMEVARAERDRSIMEIFFAAIQRHFGRRFAVETPLSSGDKDILLILSSIDFSIRRLRRLDVVESLAKLDPGLRIVVTLTESMREKIPSLQSRPNIELVGSVDVARARELYLSSKYAINVNPTFHALVSERVRNAMAFGCCVLSDRNSHIAEVFKEGEEILFMADHAPDCLSGCLRADIDEAQAIASRAHQRVAADFSLAHLADDIIAVMEEVL